jgi:hypothetical protein
VADGKIIEDWDYCSEKAVPTENAYACDPAPEH